MDMEQIMRLVTALETVAGVLQQLGPGGIILVVLSGPAVVLLAVLGIDYLRGHQVAKMVEDMRSESRKTLDRYRQDTQDLLRELGENHAQVIRFYENNVELVKGYDRLSKDHMALIAGATKALERLTAIIEFRGDTK